MQTPSFDVNYTDFDIKNMQFKYLFFRNKENDFKWISILFLFFTIVHVTFIQRISYSSIVSLIILFYCSYNVHLLRCLNEIVNDKDQGENRLSLYQKIIMLRKYYNYLFAIVIGDIIANYLCYGKEIFTMANNENKFERIFFYLFNFCLLARILIMVFIKFGFTDLFAFLKHKSTDNEKISLVK